MPDNFSNAHPSPTLGYSPQYEFTISDLVSFENVPEKVDAAIALYTQSGERFMVMPANITRNFSSINAPPERSENLPILFSKRIHGEMLENLPYIFKYRFFDKNTNHTFATGVYRNIYGGDPVSGAPIETKVEA